MNGIYWTIEYVSPLNPMLLDRTGSKSVATTDGITHTVYLSSDLVGDFKTTVIIHEMGHVAMYSYNLFDDIHRMVYPEYWIEAEEWICNFIADYGKMIFKAASKVLGRDGWICIPKELDNLIYKGKK